jgi:heptaprenyl diphosphate synthase
MIRGLMMSLSESPLRKSGSSELTKTAMLAAFALFLSTVEYMIPKPLPFLRIGLANVPVMIALGLLSFPDYLVLIALKIIGQGLVNGTLFSYIFVYSAGGSLSSAVLMYLLFKLPGRQLSYIGISTAGAMTSNAVQLLLAQYLLFGGSIWIIAPPFLALGFVSSILLGIFTNEFTRRSLWYRRTWEMRESGSDSRGGLP